MSTSLLCSQIRQRTHQMSQNILDNHGPLSHTRSFGLFLPAVIATAGSVFGLSIGSVARLSTSRCYHVLGNALGIVPILLSAVAGDQVISALYERLDPLMRQAKFHNYEVVKQFEHDLKDIQYHFNHFMASLEPEQQDVFFSVLSEWDYYCPDHSLQNPRSQFDPRVDASKAKKLEEIASSFQLTRKQRDLIDQHMSVSSTLFPVEVTQVKWLEMLCKFFTAEGAEVFDDFARVLMLTPRQKLLFNKFVSTLKKDNEEIIFATTLMALQEQMRSKIISSFGKQFEIAHVFSFLGVTIYSLLTILKPIGLLEIIKPLGILWGTLQIGSLLAGAFAVAYVYHQCFYLNVQADIRSYALQMSE